MFRFGVPAIPSPPIINDVTNTSPTIGDNSFLVVATIVGQLQQSPVCDKPAAECAPHEWYLKPTPGVSPNPPKIKMVKIYYALNDSPAASVDMVEASELGENKWKANVPIDSTARPLDIFTYYIVAMDGRGNVASQVPNTGAASSTCPPSPSSWFAELATPVTDSCAYATSYSQCNANHNETPVCGSSFTTNDKTGDVCGEPDVGGSQTVVDVPKLDIRGISAAADKDYFCLNMGLGAAPPDSNDFQPVEMYQAAIFNTDIYDDNPADPHVKNAYVLTYMPEMQGIDPTLVRVMWDSNCVTDPDTPNILDCKLTYVTGTDKRLQAGYNGALRFIVKRSGTGNPHAVPFNLIGNTRKLSYVVATTGELDLTGGNPFWISDQTPGMSFYHKNLTTTLGYVHGPMIPLLKQTKCSITGSGGTSGTCSKTTPFAPSQNICAISFQKSLTSGVESYKIYKGKTDKFSEAALLTTVASTGADAYSFNDTIPRESLDGAPLYYFVSAVKAGTESITEDISNNRTTCTVEDWSAPVSPVITKAATPGGNEKKCRIEFTMPSPDPSLSSFVILRDETPLNAVSPMGAEPGAASFGFTDPAVLNLNQQYSYTVQAIDIGDNTSTSAPVTCTPEDLKPPAQPESIIALMLSGKLGTKIEWPASTEPDLAGYRAKWCRLTNSSINCRSSSEFSLLSGPALIDKTATSFVSFDTGVFTSEGDYCFYIEAVDNCDTAGTCPSRGAGNPNVSGFPSGGADSAMKVACLQISPTGYYGKPAFPLSVKAVPVDSGGKCKITWEKNYQKSDGAPFSGTQPIVNPKPMDLVGYKVMRGIMGAVPTPAQANPVGAMSYMTLEFTDTTVVNGNTYSYVVYAIDSQGNFSENGIAGNGFEVTCTPGDKLAPAPPVMSSPIAFNEISCSPSWGAVADAISYDVYKCAGGLPECNSADKFATDTDCKPGAATTCTNNTSLTTDNRYTFCVTATDATGNESAITGATGTVNCGECIPTARPKPVTDVHASLRPDCQTVKIYWTNSESLAANNTSASGVNIYRCTDASCSTKTTIKPCSLLPANGKAVQNIGFNDPVYLYSEPVGSWFYGVTFQTDCVSTNTESYLNGGTSIDGSIETCIIESPCFGNIASCIIISACSDADLLDANKNMDCGLREVAVSNYSVAQDYLGYTVPLSKDPARAKYKSGVDVYLVKESDGSIVRGPVSTDKYGNYSFDIDNTGNAVVDTSKKYSLVMRIPAADKAGIPCTKASDLGSALSGVFGSDCGIIFARGLTLKNGTQLKARFPMPLPAKGQGRSEIGNFDCDKTIGLKDFSIFQKNFKLGRVSDGAAKYADINQDGYVNLVDFVLFKQNMGKVLDTAPAYVQDLCKP